MPRADSTIFWLPCGRPERSLPAQRRVGFLIGAQATPFRRLESRMGIGVDPHHGAVSPTEAGSGCC